MSPGRKGEATRSCAVARNSSFALAASTASRRHRCARNTLWIARSAFGLMMFCVELNIANIQPKLRENCGFLFTFLGRALFVLL